MKKYLFALVISLVTGLVGQLAAQNRFWVAASPSNWNNPANWSTTSGGAGGASVPGATEVAIFNANGAGDCLLDIAPTVGGITVNGYVATINLQGNNLTTTGTTLFTTGSVTNSGASAGIILNTLNTTTFNGTLISVNVSGSTGRLFFNGSTFNGSVNVNKTDANSDFSAGGNTFNGVTTITNLGDGFVLLGNTNRDQFTNVTTFNNNGTNRFYFAHNHSGQTTTFSNDLTLNTNKSGGADQWSYLIADNNGSNVSFGGNVTINCAGTLQSNHRILQGGGQATYTGTLTVNLTNTHPSTSINMGTLGNSVYNGDIVVSNSGGGSGIYFNTNAASSSVLAATRTITIGAGGFIAGQLSLPRFTQTGVTAQTLTNLTGTSTLTVGPDSDFGGTVNFAAPQLLLNGAIYRETTTLEKTGATGDFGSGGNTFNGTTTINNSGSGELFLGNGNADTFNGTTIFNNTGSFRIRIAYNHQGQTTTFNGNVTLNSNKSGGSDPWSFLVGEVNDSNIAFAGSLTINVAGSVRSDYRFLNGTGSVGTFGPVTINLTNTHASTVVTMGVNGTATYNQDIVVSNPGGTNGVVFNANAAASATLAAGRTVTIGGTGFTAGVLSLARFVQTSATNQTLTAFSGTAALAVGPDSQFGGNVNFAAPRLFLNGCTYGGTVTAEKNGASDDSGAGGNIFNGVTTITNSGSGYLYTGATNRDQFMAATTFNVTGSGRLHFAHNHGGQTTTFASTVLLNMNKTGAVDQWGILFCEGVNTAVIFGGAVTIQNAGSFRSDTRFLNGTGSTAVYNGPVNVDVTNSNTATNLNMGTNGQSTFNENIQLSSTGGANGVFFNNGASGSSTLATGKTISIGAGGFTGGNLYLQRFTQVGPTAQTLTLTGTALLLVGSASQFDGDVNFSSPRLLLNGATYGGMGNFEKTGASDDASSGGNIFTGATTITHNGSGNMYLGNGNRDQFLSTAVFNNTGSYRFFLAHNHNGQTTEFASNVTFNSNKSGGSDNWSFFVADNTNSFVSFGGTVTLNCAGALQSNCRFLNGTGSTGLYSGLVTVNVTNTNPGTTIYMGVNGTSTYTGNINVSNTGGAAGINFNDGTPSSSILSGSISSGGFSSGQLNLHRFTQVGAIPQSLTLTTTGTLLRIGPSSSFDGAVTFIAPRLLLNGATYNGTTYLEKNNASDDNGAGGNIFNGPVTIVNSGSGYLLTANTSPDIFTGDATITNSGSNYIYLAHAVAGNQFNGNIILNNFGSAQGIRFSNNAAGTTTFNASTNKTLSVGGSGFSVGELGLRRFTQTGTSAQTLTLTGSTTQLNLGPASEFNGNVTFTSPKVFLNGARYNGTAYIEKTAATNDDGTGGNIFMLATTLANSGSNYLLTGSTNPDTFNGVLTITNLGSSSIRLADNSAGNQFNENIQLNSISGGGIFFGNNATGTSTLAAGKTISVGSTGFITGDVRLIRFTQVGPTPQVLDLGGIAILTLGPASSFGGNIDFRSPQLYLNGTTFSGTSYLEKKGATDNYSNGGNTFVGSSTLVDSGSGYFAMAQNAPDVFQSDLTATNTGSNIIYLANNVAGNVFNGNITFNSTLGSAGIYIGNNAPAAATLGNGASLLTGGAGFSSGELRLKRLTQIGSANQTLTLTGTALLRIGPVTTFNGNLNFRSPQIALDGAVYNGVTYLEKTGANNNDSGGGNSFLGATTTIVNSGTGYFRFAVTSLDTFGAGDLILTNTGTSTIRMADNVPGSVFNGNIFVNSTFGGGIYFSESGGGTATLSAGKTIAAGGTGFTTGDLRLRRFTQADATTPQTLLLTGTATLVLGPTIAFSGNSDFRAPQILMNGGTFNGTALIEKTGASDNTGSGGMTFQSTTTLRLSGTGQFRTNGGNTFNGTTSIINNGSNYMLFELVSGSTYNDLTITNTGSSNIRMGYTGTTAFNGNILVNSTAGTGVYFVDSGTGAATLAAGRTIAVGGTGFSAGELRIQRFTQAGTTAQNLVLTGAGTLRSGPTTTWNGNITAIAPAILLDGTTFNGTTNSITKNGTTTDVSAGGNSTAAGTTTTFTNSTAGGVFRFANATADDFTGNVIFAQPNGTIQPAYSIASTFRGDVTVNSAAAIVFGGGAGGITFTGTTNQNVAKSGAASPTFRRLVMNKASGTVTLNTDALVSITATFTSGVMNTTSTNFLNFADDATTTGANNLSFVDGPVRKTGNDIFTFPVGDNTFYRPVSISAPTGTAHFFTAQYVNTNHNLGSPAVWDPSFTTVSGCEYWTLDRNTAPTSNVLVTLSWQEAACVPGYITNPATLRVARWSGTNWVNHGNGGTTGTATNGTIVTSSAVTAFSPFTLASVSLANPLPVELTWFKASLTESGTGLLEWRTESELNNDHFEVERSMNGVDFTQLGNVQGAGTTNNSNNYKFEDKNPLPGVAYYRLKQVDFDGTFDYSSIIALDYKDAEAIQNRFFVSPNPINSGDRASFKTEPDNVTGVTKPVLHTVTVFNNLNQAVRKYSDVDGFSTEGLAPGIYIVRKQTGEIFRLVIK